MKHSQLRTMRWRLFAVLATLGVIASACQRKNLNSPVPSVSTIAFGSSSRQTNSQTFWRQIAQNDPELWIWTGDCVYAPPGDLIALQRAFIDQANNPEYQSFKRRTRILGVWDTFDYGQRPGRADNPIRTEAQKLYLDFLGEPQLSRRRQEPGIFTSQQYGPPGSRIKVILLDVRTFNLGPDSPVRHRLLGEKQWAWLETELSNTDAQFIFLVTPIPLLPIELNVEKWADYGEERADLFRLLGNTRAHGVIILSGGRQLGEISATKSHSLQYMLYEATASGLTYFDHEYSGDFNRYRIGEVFIGLHFGLINIDWSKQPPHLRIQIRDDQNRLGIDVEERRKSLEPPGGERRQRKRAEMILGAD